MTGAPTNICPLSTEEQPSDRKFKFQQYDWLDESRGVPLYWHWDDHGQTNAICYSLGAKGLTKSQKGALVRIALHAHYESQIANRAIHYSRSKNAIIWSLPRTRKLPFYSYSLIISAIEFLNQHGFITHDTASAGVKGKQSEFRATARLLLNLAHISYDVLPPSHPVILRDASGEELELPIRRYIDRMSNRVDAQNKLILDTEFTALPELRAPMRRIFLRDMRHNGRFYCIGASWQNVRRETRQFIELEGERTTLLDFSACNPNIAYRLVAESPLDEPYQCDGFTRAESKLALMILLNASDKQEAISALAFDRDFLSDQKINEKLPNIFRQREKAKFLIEQLESLHAPLVDAGMFFGSGLRLMRSESDIADRVMTDLRNLGIVSLPIHDGFMVKERHKSTLEASMREQSKMGTPNSIPISVEF